MGVVIEVGKLESGSHFGTRVVMTHTPRQRLVRALGPTGSGGGSQSGTEGRRDGLCALNPSSKRCTSQRLLLASPPAGTPTQPTAPLPAPGSRA
jgi:hypothetical protein